MPLQSFTQRTVGRSLHRLRRPLGVSVAGNIGDFTALTEVIACRHRRFGFLWLFWHSPLCPGRSGYGMKRCLASLKKTRTGSRGPLLNSDSALPEG
jgi:hypothetical protein